MSQLVQLRQIGKKEAVEKWVDHIVCGNSTLRPTLREELKACPVIVSEKTHY